MAALNEFTDEMSLRLGCWHGELSLWCASPAETRRPREGAGSALSYDLRIWSCSRPDVGAIIASSSAWQQESDVFIFRQRNWQVVIGPIHAVDQDDVPHEVGASLPGITFLTELNLEPGAALKSARSKLLQIGRNLAKASHGAMEDPQEDKLILPPGVRRYQPASRPTDMSIVTLSWYSTSDEIRSAAWLDGLLSCMERFIPEALPKRYGDYEPPQFRYAEKGRSHLVEFLTKCVQKGDIIVWFPSAPVVKVSMSIPPRIGASRSGWRCNRLSIGVNSIALDQPGWECTLSRLWRKVASLMSAFYADVRLLRGYEYRGGRLLCPQVAESHPIVSWFWAGIPTSPAVSVAVGNPYLNLWRGIDRSDVDHGIAFMESRPWLQGGRPSCIAADVPASLALQPNQQNLGGLGPNSARDYPKDWPFGKTHDSSWA